METEAEELQRAQSTKASVMSDKICEVCDLIRGVIPGFKDWPCFVDPELQIVHVRWLRMLVNRLEEISEEVHEL